MGWTQSLSYVAKSVSWLKILAGASVKSAVGLGWHWPSPEGQIPEGGTPCTCKLLIIFLKGLFM